MRWVSTAFLSFLFDLVWRPSVFEYSFGNCVPKQSFFYSSFFFSENKNNMQSSHHFLHAWGLFMGKIYSTTTADTSFDKYWKRLIANAISTQVKHTCIGVHASVVQTPVVLLSTCNGTSLLEITRAPWACRAGSQMQRQAPSSRALLHVAVMPGKQSGLSSGMAENKCDRNSRHPQ